MKKVEKITNMSILDFITSSLPYIFKHIGTISKSQTIARVKNMKGEGYSFPFLIRKFSPLAFPSQY
jgi:hypothetical protein